MGQTCSCLDQSFSASRSRRRDSSESSPGNSSTRSHRSLIKDPSFVDTHEATLSRRSDESRSRRNSQTMEIAQTTTTYMDQTPKFYQNYIGIEYGDSSVDPAELECVICLDTFDESNPKIRTLCNCGMNRTNFHLSCLLEWINRDKNCPVCREYLFFEENFVE